MAEIELTERELLVAQKAAQLAVQGVTDEFYRQVGKTVVNRFLIIIGAAAVGFLAHMGWVTWKP